MRTVETLCVRDWSVTAENGDYFEVRQGETYTTSLPNKAPSIGPEPKAGHVVVLSNYWVQVPVDVFSFPEGTDNELTDEDMEDSTENVLGLKDQVIGLEHLIREKDEEIARKDAKLKTTDRLAVIAVKWCDRKHHDWDELTKLLDSGQLICSCK